MQCLHERTTHGDGAFTRWMVIARNSKHIGVYNDIAYLSVSISESDVSLLKTSHEESHEYQLVQNKS